VLSEFLLRKKFVESLSAPGHALAGVGNAALLENLLQLAVFAEGAMDCDEGDLGVVRQGKIRAPHIHFRDLCA
jgi:hypothetical protein